jgi:hypothetical protein
MKVGKQKWEIFMSSMKDLKANAALLTEVMNEASNLIRSTEKELEGLGINLTYRVKVYSRYIKGQKPENEYLVWGMCPSAQRFRLLHYSEKDGAWSAVSPLIEKPLNVRMNIVPHIPKFLEKFNKLIIKQNKVLSKKS